MNDPEAPSRCGRVETESVLSLQDPRSIEELLNYRLTRLIAESGAPVVRLCEGRYGISRREWRMIALLAIGGALSSSELAERAHLDRTRTSRAISSLVGKKLVRRQQQAGDRRWTLLTLTQAGADIYAGLFPVVVDLNKRLVASLDPAALDAFEQGLSRLMDAAVRLNGEVAKDVHPDRGRARA